MAQKALAGLMIVLIGLCIGVRTEGKTNSTGSERQLQTARTLERMGRYEEALSNRKAREEDAKARKGNPFAVSAPPLGTLRLESASEEAQVMTGRRIGNCALNIQKLIHRGSYIPLRGFMKLTFFLPNVNRKIMDRAWNFLLTNDTV